MTKGTIMVTNNGFRSTRLFREGSSTMVLFFLQHGALRSYLRDLNGSTFVPTCHHCGVIGHIRPQCSMLKREQNHVARSLPKKPSGPKHIVCHHCGAFGHLRPHCSKFQALKRIKREEKLELFGSCAL